VTAQKAADEARKEAQEAAAQAVEEAKKEAQAATEKAADEAKTKAEAAANEVKREAEATEKEKEAVSAEIPTIPVPAVPAIKSLPPPSVTPTMVEAIPATAAPSLLDDFLAKTPLPLLILPLAALAAGRAILSGRDEIKNQIEAEIELAQQRRERELASSNNVVLVRLVCRVASCNLFPCFLHCTIMSIASVSRLWWLHLSYLWELLFTPLVHRR
jgi:hypothetical protein